MHFLKKNLKNNYRKPSRKFLKTDYDKACGLEFDFHPLAMLVHK